MPAIARTRRPSTRARQPDPPPPTPAAPVLRPAPPPPPPEPTAREREHADRMRAAHECDRAAEARREAEAALPLPPRPVLRRWAEEVERRTEEARAAAAPGAVPVVDLTECHPRGAIPPDALRGLRLLADPRWREARVAKAADLRARARRRESLADMEGGKGNAERAEEHRLAAGKLHAEADAFLDDLRAS